jgi:hypothetical protein
MKLDKVYRERAVAAVASVRRFFERAWGPLLVLNTVLLLVAVAGLAVLFLRIVELEDRVAYKTEPALAEARDMVEQAKSAMLQMQLRSAGTTAPRKPRAPAPRPSSRGSFNRRPPSSARTPAPSSRPAKREPPPPPAPAAPAAAKVHATPEGAVREFLDLLTEGPLNAADKSKLRSAYSVLISHGEAVVYPLLNYLTGVTSTPESASFLFKAIEELATLEHKDLILQLFETHEDLAGAIAALRLPGAEPLILAKLREDRTSYPAGVLRAVKTLRLKEAYPLLAEYSASSGDLEAVGILCSVSADEYDASDDLVRILDNSDGWPENPQTKMAARKAARALIRMGKKPGLDYMVSQLETQGDNALDAASMRALRRSVDYAGTMREFATWLSINAASLEWSESKKVFALPD